MHRAGLLGISIPKKHGGLGADYQTYALAAAEIGRYCGATALTWNMHVCSTLWSGPLADDLDMDGPTRAEHERRRAIHYKRIVDEGAIYSQPFSEGGAAAAGGVAFGTEAKPVKGGWIVNGKKIFASLSGHADYYGVLCTETLEGEKASRRNTLYLALPANASGVSVVGDWDPLGMRGTVSRTLLFKDVFVEEDAALMPRGVYFQAAHALAAYVPDAVADLYGPGAGGLRFHRALSARRGAGHAAGQAADVSDQADRGGADANQTRADQGDSGSRRSPKPAPIRARSRYCAPMLPSIP